MQQTLLCIHPARLSGIQLPRGSSSVIGGDNARWDEVGVVLPCLARHELLLGPLSEFADEAGPERPIAGPANDTHEPQISLGGAEWPCRRPRLVQRQLTGGKVQVVDMRLEPAAHSNAKDLVPEIHWNDAAQMACGDLPDNFGRVLDSVRCLIPRCIRLSSEMQTTTASDPGKQGMTSEGRNALTCRPCADIDIVE